MLSSTPLGSASQENGPQPKAHSVWKRSSGQPYSVKEIELIIQKLLKKQLHRSMQFHWDRIPSAEY
jgi:hypothetical protein